MIPLMMSLLTACCGRDEPEWLPIDDVYLGAGSVTIDLSTYLIDDRQKVAFTASDDPDVVTELDGSVLTLTGQPGWEGLTTISVGATDKCGAEASTTIEVSSEPPPTTTAEPTGCATTFTWTSPNAPDGVAVAGDWNAWSSTEDPMTLDGSTWTLTLRLPPGPHAYKLVELQERAFGPEESWGCDPSARYAQCDPGSSTPWDAGFDMNCAPGAASCNSVVVVPTCAAPHLAVDDVDLDRGAGTLSVAAAITLGAGGDVVSAEATLDGAALTATVDGDHVRATATGLSVGRHTLRLRVTDSVGNVSDEVQVPVWTDDFDWKRGVVYFAFVDRMLDGDASNDDPTGATAIGGDYEGGDWAGLRTMLPYLDDLGVSVLWLSNPQDNAEGAFAGSCDLTYAGYHAYWPADATATESRFGTDAELMALVDEAHARGMRVIMDWVGNHVHEDHPYYADHPEWFHPYANCNDRVDGALNFDRIPEECWFAPYLPDVDYSQTVPLMTMVEDAIWWAETYELDGLRVDAVKHMSHATAWDLNAAIEEHLEHNEAGSPTDLWTVGET
ncbi:MAG: hypothetical protein H6734_27845, partial [Alphaproteobacteria bacterium]|nr:hypothetical protein [Alphaproteobacteria bacterium]